MLPKLCNLRSPLSLTSEVTEDKNLVGNPISMGTITLHNFMRIGDYDCTFWTILHGTIHIKMSWVSISCLSAASELLLLMFPLPSCGRKQDCLHCKYIYFVNMYHKTGYGRKH